MKSIIRYGVISGLVVVGISLLVRAFGSGDFSYQTQEVLGYISMFMGLSLVYFGIRHDRSMVLQGKVGTKNILDGDQGRYTFGRGMLTGSGISVISALIFSIFVVILFITNPELGDELMAKYMEGLEQSGATPAQLEMALQQIEAVPEWMKSPVGQGLIMFFTVLVLGLLLSLIFSAILRTKA